MLIGYALSYIAQGAWFGASDQRLWASLTVLKTYDFLGMFKLPWVNWDFFTVGLPSLFTFNFSFFGGDMAFFKYGMYVLSVGIIWGMVVVFVGFIVGFITKR